MIEKKGVALLTNVREVGKVLLYFGEVIRFMNDADLPTDLTTATIPAPRHIEPSDDPVAR